MSCNICDFHKNPNNPRCSVTHACLDAVDARVAKLEAAADPQRPTAEQLIAPGCECTQHGKCFNEASLSGLCARCVSTLNPCTRASHLRRVGSAGTSEPIASGQLASAGEATVPPGLYRKFTVERTDGSSSPGGKHERCEYFVLDWAHDKYARPAALAYASACEAEYPDLARDLRDRAVAVVANVEPPRTAPLARDEPPAEQPSRQETGVGETTCKPDCGTSDNAAWMANRWGIAHFFPEHPNGPFFCTEACRDRAKAKAAEPSRFAGFTPFDQPAEPSGTGQLPTLPVCQCGHPRWEHARLTDGCVIGIEEGWRCKCERYRRQETNAPIAELTAPAAGTLSEQKVCPCDSCQGTVYATTCLRSTKFVIALEAKLAQAERERDGERKLLGQAQKSVAYWRAELDKAWKERDELGRQVEQMAEHVATIRVERAHEQNGWNGYARKLEKERDEALAKLAAVGALVERIDPVKRVWRPGPGHV